MENELDYNEDHASLLVRRYADMMMRIAFTYLKNRTDAQDICQEVFVKLFKQQRTFEHAEHEKAWIIRVTANACKDALRSPWRRLFSPISDAAPIPIRNETNKEVVASVLELPMKYRIVIYLYYFEGYRTAEIAALLGKKEATIRTQLKRAREMLKTNMIEGGLAYE